MLLVIPALQLIDGHCSLTINGEKGTESLYAGLSERPSELCRLWRRENAKTIHITDYDSFYSKADSNVDSIILLAESVDIPFQVLANFRSVEECEYLLDNGIYRIILGELTLIDPEGSSRLIEKYSTSRVVGYVDSRKGNVSFDRFRKTFLELEFTQYLKGVGFKRILYKEEDWLNEEKGVNIDKLVKIAIECEMKITLFDAVCNAEQLWALNELIKYGIDSLVIGQALYNNNFPCQKIWRMIESDLER